MLPSKTREVIGHRTPTIEFERYGVYQIEGWRLSSVEGIMGRLYREQRMDADEMRDIAHVLNIILSEAKNNLVSNEGGEA